MQIKAKSSVGRTSLLLSALSTAPAAASSRGSLPREAPLQRIKQSITGPVASFIALAAVAVAEDMLIFGGELNDFSWRLMYIVLVASILLGANQIVGLFGATGATIGHLSPLVDPAAGEGARG